ncbi:putative esterase [Rhizodiscina lignyota]|uniref:Esterase n=1 Tax=Rhizodiscina lignyota TaxID=1504668 RepID=A0A9P4IK92_9PEZI|nr:putative esterase [Rhizodiscina lignyota]
MSLDKSRLDGILDKYVSADPDSKDTLRTAALIVKDKAGKTVYSNALGTHNFETNSPPFTADSVGWIASMTKLITAVCAMQLVEKGNIGLDDEVGEVVPHLSKIEVLKGFEEDGTPILTKPNKALTLRYLLTHSSGFTYDASNADLIKWSAYIGRTVNAQSRTLEGITFPLIFDPGEGWSYSVGIDWAGRVVEALSNSTLGEYMERHIFEPLSMSSTTFQIHKRPELAARRTTIAWRSSPDAPLGLGDGNDPAPKNPEIEMGGGGLFTTANDYAEFLGALISGDSRILKPESIAELFKPQLDDPKHFQAFCDGPLHDAICPEFPHGLQLNYALGGKVNLEDVPGKRRKGSMAWSGATNPHWWIDPETGIAAVIFTQIFPFGDPVLNSLYNKLERAIYQTFKTE